MRLCRGRADVEPLDEPLGPCEDRRKLEHNLVLRKVRVALVTEDQVVGHGIVEDQSTTAPVLRDVRDAGPARLARVEGRGLTVTNAYMSAAGLEHTGQRRHQLALPVALDPRNAQDLAAAQLEGHAAY